MRILFTVLRNVLLETQFKILLCTKKNVFRFTLQVSYQFFKGRKSQITR